MALSNTLKLPTLRGDRAHLAPPSLELESDTSTPPPTLAELTRDYIVQLLERTGFRRLERIEGWQPRVLDGLDQNALLPITLREGAAYRVTAGITLPNFIRPNHFNSVLITVHGPRSAFGFQTPTLCFSRPGTYEERRRSLVTAQQIFVNNTDTSLAFDSSQPSRLDVGRDLYHGPSYTTGQDVRLFHTDRVSRAQFEIYTTPHPRGILIRNTSNQGTTIQLVD